MNHEVRFRGTRDVPLDAVGRREALHAAYALRPVPIRRVYVSPLERARNVGVAIAAVHGLDDVHDEPGLLNLDYGEWEGLTPHECEDRHPEHFRVYATEPESAVCPGGEALAAAADRIVEALRSIGDRHAGEHVAAVTHGAMVRLAVLRIAGTTEGDWQFRLPTGTAVVIDVGERMSIVSAPDRDEPDPVKGTIWTGVT
jgi:broad specificity phosphatase PhoE